MPVRISSVVYNICPKQISIAEYGGSCKTPGIIHHRKVLVPFRKLYCTSTMASINWDRGINIVWCEFHSPYVGMPKTCIDISPIFILKLLFL